MFCADSDKRVIQQEVDDADIEDAITLFQRKSKDAVEMFAGKPNNISMDKHIPIIRLHAVEKNKIQSSRDLLTLLTCHPYASGGRQRYVVYCERTEN